MTRVLRNATPALTPVERHGDYWVKRDDRFRVGDSCGGKVRTCLQLATEGRDRGAHTLVTAGSRHSPQVNIVATVATHLGMAAECHVPAGPETPELTAARTAGAIIVAHRPGYNTVIVSRARDAAAQPGRVHIPFGMQTPLAVEATAAQAANIPLGCRVVVPVGSGMSLAGIIAGTADDTPILGVVVGAGPTKRLDLYAPEWRERVTLIDAGLPYDRPAPVTVFFGIGLDPIYEAKCVPFLLAGDLFWIVGRRGTTSDSNIRANS